MALRLNCVAERSDFPATSVCRRYRAHATYRVAAVIYLIWREVAPAGLRDRRLAALGLDARMVKNKTHAIVCKRDTPFRGNLVRMGSPHWFSTVTEIAMGYKYNFRALEVSALEVSELQNQLALLRSRLLSLFVLATQPYPW